MKIVNWARQKRSIHEPLRLHEPDSKKFKAQENMCAVLCLADGEYQNKHSIEDFSSVVWISWLKSDARVTRAIRIAGTVVGPAQVTGPFTEAEIVEMAKLMCSKAPRIVITIFLDPIKPSHVIGAPDGDWHIDLALSDGHAILIRKLHGYMGGVAVCRICWSRCTEKNHLCEMARCELCMRPGCGGTGEAPPRTVDCRECLRSLGSVPCWEEHRSVGVCSKRSRCRICREMMNMENGGVEASSSRPVDFARGGTLQSNPVSCEGTWTMMWRW